MKSDGAASRLGDRPMLGILLLVACLVAMAGIGGLAKVLSAHYSIAQILLFRFGFAVIPFLVMLPRHGGYDALRTRRLGDHAVRVFSGITALSLFFYAIATIPLADATALAYAAPIFIVILSVPILGEIIGYRRWVAVGTGFIGVLMIAQPGIFAGGLDWSPGYMAGVGSAIFGAVVSVFLRRMAPTERTSTIAIYYNTTGALFFGSWVLIAGWITPDTEDLLLLILLGALAGPQQYMLTASYRFAEASLLAPFDYIAMVIAALVGYLFWSEVPAMTTWFGCAIIAGSGIFVAYRERMVMRKPR